MILSVALMTLDHRFGQLEKVRGVLATALYPVQYIVHLPLAGLSWLSDTASTHSTLLDENAQLREESLLLKARLQKFEALSTENQRLRELLDSASKIEDRVLIAEVLRVEVDSLKRQIIINKGTLHEVSIGQTVIDAYGVVGQVIHVSPYTATVMLITSPDHAIPVQVSRNGIRSIAIGSPEEGRLELPYLATNADVKTDDLLVTSGLGGRFPYGYPVARVYRVEQDDSTSFSNIYASPTARLDSHREVLLVWPEAQANQVNQAKKTKGDGS